MKKIISFVIFFNFFILALFCQASVDPNLYIYDQIRIWEIKGIVDGKIIATVLAGHDGRRGFIHHMAVSPDYRRQGIGSSLAKEADKRIKKSGIAKTHIFCYKNNDLGQNFWKAMGFTKREDIDVFSFD